jgi:hypothetical protein
LRPDAAMFQQHINEADFQLGIDNGSWGFLNSDEPLAGWPNVTIWVKAAKKANWPDKYYFSFELSGYPGQAATACPWNAETNARLDNSLWPRGNRFVSHTFNFGWNANALYAPCDRLAMQGHDGWREQFPELWWQPDFTITVYLNFIYHLLNSSDYAKS